MERIHGKYANFSYFVFFDTFLLKITTSSELRKKNQNKISYFRVWGSGRLYVEFVGVWGWEGVCRGSAYRQYKEGSFETDILYLDVRSLFDLRAAEQ